MRILLVEDDVGLSASLADALTDERYVVQIARDGEMGWQQIKTLAYDLVLLDVALPKLDGISLCQRMRARGVQIPLLMLTARDTSSDKIMGLNAGADDYVVKPFDLGELLARVRALLRRGLITAMPLLEWGDLQVDPQTYEVTFGGREVRLTPKEFALLELLIRHGRRVLSKPFIIEHLWSLEDPPEEEAVKAHIKSLRSKLKAVGCPEDYIETVHGLGYRLKQMV
jgi:DNA-binding response OmpR family regulator